MKRVKKLLLTQLECYSQYKSNILVMGRIYHLMFLDWQYTRKFVSASFRNMTLSTIELQDTYFICGALRDLVSFVKFKKLEKHLWRSVTFSEVTDLNKKLRWKKTVYWLKMQATRKKFSLFQSFTFTPENQEWQETKNGFKSRCKMQQQTFITIPRNKIITILLPNT